MLDALAEGADSENPLAEEYYAAAEELPTEAPPSLASPAPDRAPQMSPDMPVQCLRDRDSNVWRVQCGLVEGSKTCIYAPDAYVGEDGTWGGTPERIKETITLGRQGMMPPMAAAVGTAADVRNVANYVLSLSGSAHNDIAAELGRPKFAVCAACHGPAGKGTPALGAPNLADNVWLPGWGEEAIVAMITNGKANAMPAQGERMTAEQIHVLTAYVWGLSNAPAAAGP